MASKNNNSDILLIVGADYSLSYDAFTKDIEKIVKDLNKNPPKIKVEFDISQAAKKLNKQISEIGGSIKLSSTPGVGIGGANINVADYSSWARNIRKVTKAYNDLTASINNFSDTKKKSPDADLSSNVSISGAKSALVSASNLLNKNKNASELQSYKDLKTWIDNISTALNNANGSEEQFRANLKGLGSEGKVALDKLRDTVLNLKLEMANSGISGNTSMSNVSSALTSAYNLLNSNQDISGVTQYTELKNLVDIIGKAFVDAKGNEAAFSSAIQQNFANNKAALDRVNAAMEALKLAKAGAASYDGKLVAGTIAQNNALKNTEALLGQVRIGLASYAAYSNGSMSGVYKNYEAQEVALSKLFSNLKRGSISASEFAKEYSKISNSVKVSEAMFKAAGNQAQTLTSKITSLARSMGFVINAATLIRSAWRTIKNMVSVTIELDSAFTQLKIVTGATDKEMQSFMQTTIDLSKNLGQSITDVAKSVEVFSRLGYSLPDASKLAEYATILSNVASVSVDKSTTGLTSIIKGFNLNTDDVEHVADVLVEVGQKYAVSASEMMDAFEKSGAALNATNVSFEQAAGLIAAANASVQNSSTVGTALKTVSARIRGSKTELEELGEDVSELADGFSKYAEEFKAISGVDIMKSANEFKNLYEIMNEVSKVWDNLTDTQQSRVSEILGGTRQLQVISSIIGNWKDASSAVETAMNSAGAAAQANSIYMDSAQAHINKFNVSFQELSTSLVNSQILKLIVDIGSGLLNTVTALQRIGVLLPALTTVISVIINMRKSQRIEETAAKIGALTATLTKEKGAVVSLAGSVANLTKKEKELLVTQIQEAVAHGDLTQAQAEEILSTYGLVTAENTLEVTNGGLAASFKALMASIPVWGWIALGVSVVIEVFSALMGSIESSADKLKRLNEEMEQLKSTTNSIVTEYRQIKESADEVIPRFVELAKGVDDLGGKVSLTDDEYAEFISLNNRIAEMFPELNLGMDDNGNAMLALSYNADTLRESLEKLLEVQRQEANQKLADQMPEYLKNIKTSVDTMKSERDELIKNKKLLSEGKITQTWYNGNMGFEEVLKEAGIKYSVDSTGSALVWDTNSLEYINAIAAYDARIENIDNHIVLKWKELRQSVSAYLQTHPLYDEFESQFKLVAKSMVNGIDFQNLGLTDEKEIQNYIYNNIIYPLSSIESETKQMLSDAFSGLADGTISPEEFSDKITSVFNEIHDTLEKADTDTSDTFENFTNLFIQSCGEAGKAGQTFDDAVQHLVETWGKFKDQSSDPVIAKSFAEIIESTKEARESAETFASAIKKISNGESLSLDELNKLVALDSTLMDSASVTADGYSISIDALKESQDKYIESVKESIRVKIAEAEANKLAHEEKMKDLEVNESDILNPHINSASDYKAWQESKSRKAMYDAEKAAADSASSAIQGYQLILDSLSNTNSVTATSSKSLADVLSELSSKYSLLTKARKEANESGEISLSTQSEILKTYPELSDLVAAYTMGLVDEKRLIEGLSEAYEADEYNYRGYLISKVDLTDADLEAYIQYLNTKLADNEEYYEKIGALEEEFINYMQDNYGVDLSNCKTWAEAKIALMDMVRLHQLAPEDANKLIDMDTGKINQQALSNFMLNPNVSSGAKSAVVDILNNYSDAFKEFGDRRDSFIQPAGFDSFASKYGIINLFKNPLKGKGDSDDSSSSSSSKEESWFQKWYKWHNHQVEMGKETTSDYLKWLDEAFKQAYEEGIITLDEYYKYEEEVQKGNKTLYDNAKSSIDTLVDYRVKMIKQDLNNEKDALNKRLSAIKDFYDKQKKLLQDEKDEEKYIEEQAEKRKAVSDIDAELAALEFDDSAWAQKRKAELREERKNKQKELDDFESDHAYDEAIKFLDESYDKEEAKIQAEIDAIEDKLNDPQLLLNQALADIKNNTKDTYEAMLEYNRKYGDGDDETVKKMWESAYKDNLEYKNINGGKGYENISLVNATNYKAPVVGKYDNHSTPPSPTTSTNKSTTSSASSNKSSSSSSSKTSSSNSKPSLTSGSTVTVKTSATTFSDGTKMASFVPGGKYTVMQVSSDGSEVLIGLDGKATGWIRKTDIVGYASGTANATKGLHRVNEGNAEEFIFSSKDGNSYRLLNGGDKVLNGKASDFLYNFANNGQSILSNMINGCFARLASVVGGSNVVNNITMSPITITGNADAKTVSEMRRAQREALKDTLQAFGRLSKQ